MTEYMVKKMDELALAWEQAKAKEKDANDERIEIEQAIIKAFGEELPDEGQHMVETPFYKVTGTGKLTRKLDEKKFATISDSIGALAPVKVKTELDVRKYKALAESNPDVFKLMAQAVTSKPAKTAIKVERLPEAN